MVEHFFFQKKTPHHVKASYIWHHLHIKSLVFTNLFLGPKQCKSPFTWSCSLILISLTVVIRFIAFRFCATFAFKSAKFRGSTSDYFVKNDWTAILKRYHGSNERMQIFFLNQRRIMTAAKSKRSWIQIQKGLRLHIHHIPA